MLDKLKSIEEKYDNISERLSDSKIMSDPDEYKKLMKEIKNITPVVEKYREYKNALNLIKEAEDIIKSNDKELLELAKEELETAKEAAEKCEEELKFLLLPKDPNDDKNVIIEIRGGAGGEEAALFAYTLYRMYTMYAERRNWSSELLNFNETELGGFKEVSFMIEGYGAYSKLKFESGVHRVQRVPDTESSGRIHTSTVTVAVLPEVEDVEFEINPSDLQIDTYRASGAGGQHVNKTESAIRITHIPTNTIVECQDERSQHKNKDKAMRVLRSKIYENMVSEQNSKIASERKSQVGTGDRSERIRTYNYSQSRVTDHRIGLTLYKLESFLNGDLDEMIEAINTNDRLERLKEEV